MHERSTTNASEPGSAIADLSAADLQALRLAIQVMRERSRLAGRPRTERYWLALERSVDFEMARRGIGFVVGSAPALDAAVTDPADRALLAEQLELLAGNASLPERVRDVCTVLRAALAA